MPIMVHYEDNLYFLHSIVRTTDAGLRLDIDPEYFRDKVLEDILFLDAALLRLYSSLKENPQLINRARYFRALRRTIVAFVEFLRRLLDEEISIGDIAQSYHGKLSSCLHTHERVCAELDSILDSNGAEEESADTISSQEYGFLLAGGDDEDETE
jgi:hypothetical protein